MKNYLRSISILCIVVLAGLLHTAAANAATGIISVSNAGSKIAIAVNGVPINFTDQAPYVSEGRTLVPIKFIGEALGAQVTWSNPQITIVTGDKTIILTIGSKTAKVNGANIMLDVPPVISNGRTMVPLRFVGEALGAEVQYQQSGQSATPPPSNTVSLDDQHKWGLATSALVKEVNGLDFSKIGGYDRTPDFVAALKSNLAQSWEIEGRADAIETMKWLAEEGHSSEFSELGALIAQASPAEYQSLLEETGDAAFLSFVKTNYAKMGSKSLLAWDYCRLTSVAEWSYMAGYITEEEMWKYIMFASGKLQNTFSSWDEMAENYLIGRQYWSGSADPDFEQAKRSLLSKPDSPWLKYKWNLDLGTTPSSI